MSRFEPFSVLIAVGLFAIATAIDLVGFVGNVSGRGSANEAIRQSGPALDAALRATTRQDLRGAGSFDAVVMGTGAAGGLAALLLTEAGLRVLVLEAGSTGSPRRSFSRGLIRGTVARLLGSSAVKP